MSSSIFNPADFASSSADTPFLKNVVSGSASANKALVLDSSLNISGINRISANALTLGGTDVSIGSTEFLNGITAGQALGGKALVLNGSRNITNINQIETTGRFIMRTTGFGFAQEHGGANTDGEIITKVSSTAGEIGSNRSTDIGIITGNARRLTVKHTTGFVGINTSAPVRMLEVNGGCLISGEVLFSDTTASTSPTTGALRVSGGVGVAGQLSSNSLEVLRTTTGDAFKSTNGSSICAMNHINNGDVEFGPTSNHNLAFKTNNTSRILIRDNGNVGIGMSPAEKLDVGGTINATGYKLSDSVMLASALTGVSAGNALANKALILNGTRDISNINQIDTTGRININRTDFGFSHQHAGGTSDPEVVTRVNATHAQVGCFRNTDFQLITNSLARMTVLKDGNIGIGRADPTNLLDVNGTCRISGLTQIANSTPSTASTNGALLIAGGVGIGEKLHMVNNIVITAGGFNGFIHRAGTAPTDNITITEPGGIGTNNATNFHLFTNSNRRLTVLANGNVGINTQTPSSTLDVNGAINVAGTLNTFTSTTDTTVRIIANNTATNFYPTVDFVRQNTSAAFGGDNFVDWRIRNESGNFVFIAADNSIGSTECMRISSLGTVGIGITNPTATLHVGAGRATNIGVSNLYAEYGSTFNSTSQNAQPTGISRNISIRAQDGFLTNSSYFAQSDRRTKMNIVNLDHQEALHFVKSIEPVKYHLKCEDETQHKHFGYIAQDLKEYIDLLNFTERENFPKESEDDLENVALSVDYSKICVLLHKVLKSVVADLESLYESGSYIEWRRRRSQA